MNKESSSLNQKYELKEKLKKILEDVVEREVVQQAEGILAPPERDKAKNIAKTQSRLVRLIQIQEESYQIKRLQFCEKCYPEIATIKNYCSFCEDKVGCEKN